MATAVPSRAALAEVALLFFKLGVVGFGGPAAHVALMHEEVVRRRRWVTDEEFLDLLGATNLIPGPNSTELAIHLGYRRAGWAGLWTAGLCFILPAFLAVLACAWAYVRFGALPQVASALYGAKPGILAVVAVALWGLGRTALRDRLTAGVAVCVLAGWLWGVHELVLLFGSGLLAVAVRSGAASWTALLVTSAPAVAAAPAVPFHLDTLFFTFLKIGSVLYGSGYVLLAFLHADFVARLGWLSESQVLDAVAVGHVTPGPVFTTATFVGYLVGGWPGAVVATVGIFLPAFVFVAATYPLVPRMRQSRLAAPFLDGVNAASWALMAGVSLRLARASLTDGLAVVLVALALLLLWRRMNAAWVVVGCALVGVAAREVVTRL
ncbi:MAG: chromate efflux transporter [Armatimonadota bacterium]|nr:chromate efflux transporter [Armatimonadota bacterium]MDW8156475.1 chromate efflux transporter [Armatimonadota bacterium]